MTLALPKINCKTTNFPFCVVWTPNPKISWFCPIFGHMGDDSIIIIHDCLLIRNSNF